MFMRPGAVERWRVHQRQRRRPWLQAVHGARRTVRFQRSSVVAGTAGRHPAGPPARAGHARGHRQGHAAVLSARRSTASRSSRSRTGARATRSRISRRRTPAPRIRSTVRRPRARSDANRAMLTNVEDCYRDGEQPPQRVRPAEPGLPGERQPDRRVLQGAASTPPARSTPCSRRRCSLQHRQLPAAAAARPRSRRQRIHPAQSRAGRRRRLGYVQGRGRPVAAATST